MVLTLPSDQKIAKSLFWAYSHQWRVVMKVIWHHFSRLEPNWKNFLSLSHLYLVMSKVKIMWKIAPNCCGLFKICNGLFRVHACLFKTTDASFASNISRITVMWSFQFTNELDDFSHTRNIAVQCVYTINIWKFIFECCRALGIWYIHICMWFSSNFIVHNVKHIHKFHAMTISKSNLPKTWSLCNIIFCYFDLFATLN